MGPLVEAERVGGKGGVNIGGDSCYTIYVSRCHGENTKPLMQDTDLDMTPNVDETPVISEPIPFPVGPTRETVIFSEPSGRTFQEDLEEQLRQMNERHPEGLPIGPPIRIEVHR